jgi:hypothetical protein
MIDRSEELEALLRHLYRGLRTVSWDASGISNRKVMNTDQEDLNYGITT